MSNSNEKNDLQEIVARLSNALSGASQATRVRNKKLKEAASGTSNTIKEANQKVRDKQTEPQETVNQFSKTLADLNQTIVERNRILREATSGASNTIKKANQAIRDRQIELHETVNQFSENFASLHKGIVEKNNELNEAITQFSTSYKNILQQISSKNEVEKIRIYYLGKKGELTSLFRKLGAIDLAERKQIAPLLNDLKTQITLMNSERMQELVEKEEEERIENEWLDVTLPGRSRQQGSIHPVSQTIDQAVAIFSEMGFSYAEGPQIETDWYNFDALNIPPEHPARQEHDTFFIRGDSKTEKNPNVLRTHTSPVQIRSMTKQGVPIRIIAPGRVYRCDYDQTHTPMFHQIEGLAIDKNLNMAHLKWTLEEFCRTFFEVDNVELRFRASHFPFTEPSAEVDIRCSWERDLLKIGEGDDWLEILGCGMVHPNVLTACGVDKDQYQGFAFGMGLDRIAMLKYGIPDLRSFFESDIRWLRHYGFLPVDVPSLHSGLSL